MKIVSWNCNGNFRKKHEVIKNLDADIYVIQECENPDKYEDQFANFHQNYIWFGERDNKGLAIFAKENIKMTKNEWPRYCLRHFLCVNINNKVDLLGVWASPPYIEEYYIYQTINYNRYHENLIIIGDFNSNAIWDKKHGKRNHGTVVQELNQKNLISAYHYMNQEKQGEETQKTFFMYRNAEKAYHIDHCFVNKMLIQKYRVHNKEEWLAYSDHTPIELDIKN